VIMNLPTKNIITNIQTDMQTDTQIPPLKTNLIDGKAMADNLRTTIKLDTARLSFKPGLAVILVGDDPASSVYVSHKIKACEEVGFHSHLIRLSTQTTQDDLLTEITALNHNAAIHGILVQMPLPKHINSQVVIAAINPNKDVDGFHVANAGALMTGFPRLVPCTPLGVMALLEATQVQLNGAHAVVVGASNIVGKPQALLLQAAGATVTICNSKTRDLTAHLRMADIVVVAVGKPNFITGSQLKLGVVVIDVGINRQDNGRLCGDVDTASCMGIASAITPVPGGVGPMTIALLLSNTLKAATH
jgi:methylenetetrahydrofolate dehydrogenase (NADP+) / methenyltetrahydrofolate cyclohydrolase